LETFAEGSSWVSFYLMIIIQLYFRQNFIKGQTILSLFIPQSYDHESRKKSPNQNNCQFTLKGIAGLEHSLYIAKIERNKNNSKQGQINLFERQLQDFHTAFSIIIQKFTEDHSKHKETFTQYIAQFYGLKSTKQDLLRLLHHPISPRIIQLVRFEGLIQQGSWSSMNCFRGLLKCPSRANSLFQPLD